MDGIIVQRMKQISINQNEINTHLSNKGFSDCVGWSLSSCCVKNTQQNELT